MANMTKKEYELLQDAIDEGINALMADTRLSSLNFSDTSSGPRDKKSLENYVRHYIAKHLANRLRYTSDTFDAPRFMIAITNKVGN